MRIEILTLFPDSVGDVLSESILGRAQERGFIQIETRQIRDYTSNKQNQVDDYPYGGGRGAIMQADPLYRCWEAACDDAAGPVHTVFLSPCGHTFTQADAIRLSKLQNLILVCGHYEGIDERILDYWKPEEVSIGDYILTGGELAAMVVIDASVRFIPEVLGNDSSVMGESVYSGLIEYPQYTRPRSFEGLEVPEVLLSGNHRAIRLWQLEQACRITSQRRPDLWEAYLAESEGLTKEERKIIEKFR